MSLSNEQPLPIAKSWLERVAASLPFRVPATARHGMLAVVDQGVVSGTRFLTSIIIGRIAGPGELGDYALGFTLYCLAACAQEAIITLPLTIFGNRLQGDERRLFVGSALAHLFVFALSTTLLLLFASQAMAHGWGPQALVPVVRMLAVTVPFAVLVEFARRFALARLDVATALAVDVTMSILQIGGLVLLASFGLLSAVTAFGVVATVAAAAGFGWLFRSRQEFAFRTAQVWSDAITNLRFGRWALASQLTLVARNSLLPWLAMILLGAMQTGLFVACDTIVLLANPLLMSVSNILIPMASRAFAESGRARVRQIVGQATIVLAGATGLLCIVLVFFGDLILTTLLGEAYSGLTMVISLLAVMVVIESIGLAASNGLWAIEQPNPNFVANLLSLFGTLGVAAALTPQLGIMGVAWGAFAGRSIATIVQVVAFLRLTREPQQSEVLA